jgi:hypothetical protein
VAENASRLSIQGVQDVTVDEIPTSSDVLQEIRKILDKKHKQRLSGNGRPKCFKCKKIGYLRGDCRGRRSPEPKQSQMVFLNFWPLSTPKTKTSYHFGTCTSCPRKSGRVLSKDVTYAVYELKDVGAFLFRAARRAAEHLLPTRERVDKPVTPVLLRKINSDVRKAEEQRLLGEHISKVM